MQTFKSLGSQPMLLPAPAVLVGTYIKDRQPDVMTAAWCGITSSFPPTISVSVKKTRMTLGGILENKAFTVCIPSAAMAAQADYAGLVSGDRENKFVSLGWTPAVAENVDAPYVAECPVVIELALKQTVDLGSHVQCIGEVMDVKVREDCLSSDGLPDAALIDPLLFVPGIREYRRFGGKIAKAFSVGRTVAPLSQSEA